MAIEFVWAQLCQAGQASPVRAGRVSGVPAKRKHRKERSKKVVAINTGSSDLVANAPMAKPNRVYPQRHGVKPPIEAEIAIRSIRSNR